MAHARLIAGCHPHDTRKVRVWIHPSHGLFRTCLPSLWASGPCPDANKTASRAGVGTPRTSQPHMDTTVTSRRPGPQRSELWILCESLQAMTSFATQDAGRTDTRAGKSGRHACRSRTCRPLHPRRSPTSPALRASSSNGTLDSSVMHSRRISIGNLSYPAAKYSGGEANVLGHLD